MRLYPEQASAQLEFEKIKILLEGYCKSAYAKNKAQNLLIHTKKELIDLALKQAHEYKMLILQSQYFPNDEVFNISHELKLLSIPGSMLSGEQIMELRKLTKTTQNIFHWFDNEKRIALPALSKVIADTYYEKTIADLIDEVLNEYGEVKDSASPELQKIRVNLFRKRNELRRMFEKVVARLTRAGYSADIEESMSNGRRVVAVFAEHKRQVKGILHGESDSRKTAFIEPEETIQLNNEVFELENDERKEVQRILRVLTTQLSVYGSLLYIYYQVVGEYDFIRAKARLAMDINGNYPNLTDKTHIELHDAYHPLLYFFNQKVLKKTIPVNITLNTEHRILVISGPNAGGKTVAMKTVALNQVMLQSGLLIPVKATSVIGIFNQLFIHIGDTQSLEFELSTYSSHLLHMKFFIENANGKTLFFIDELGSGSDPNLGGAFAEVILEEMVNRHSFGIVTTHYLNLKVMAAHTPGIINGAMVFDEINLRPLYKLSIGKPGSSYTFSIAERIGLPRLLISKARKLVDEDHFRLDKLLNNTEQDLEKLEEDKAKLKKLLNENENLKAAMLKTMDKEKHQQRIELLKHQNKIAEERILNLKEN